MSPTIVYGPDGKVRIAIGAAGGVTIIAQVAKALVGVPDQNLSAPEAAPAPPHIGLRDPVSAHHGTWAEGLNRALAPPWCDNHPLAARSHPHTPRDYQREEQL